MTDPRPLAAGNFVAWLAEVQAAIAGDAAADVPCGDCTACCTSSQFIHIGPDETDTLSQIDPNLLFPAPRLPRGHMVLGYDERGHCPMLVDNACTIYEHRPRTCRTYDCRVFAATGVEVEGADKAEIARRVRRWRFSYPTPADRVFRESVHTAVMFLQSGADAGAPTSPTELAIRAIDTCEPTASSEPGSRDG